MGVQNDLISDGVQLVINNEGIASKSRKRRLRKKLNTEKTEGTTQPKPYYEMDGMNLNSRQKSDSTLKMPGSCKTAHISTNVESIPCSTAAKSREEILAEREAKKKAKQSAKKNNKQSQNTLENTETTLKTVAKVSEVAPAITKPSEKPVNTAATKTTPSTKSREEVLAEREAKKNAKKAAKQKQNPDGEEVVTTQSMSNQSVTTGPQLSNLTESSSKTPPEQPPRGSEKSKAELKAERRAKQESQRAAKKQELEKKSQVSSNKTDIKKLPCPSVTSTKSAKGLSTSTATKVERSGVPRNLKLFSHLELDQRPPLTELITANTHPAIVELAAKYHSRVISGSNARCVALLKALKEVVQNYVTPLEKEFSRGLESTVNDIMTYLSHSRPPSVSMTNSIRHVKSHLTQLSSSVPDIEARKKICDVIDTFVKDQIDIAGKAICNFVQEQKKISNGDIIVTYAFSSLVYRILSETHRTGTEFEVIVTDSGPWYEGREMLRRLTSVGIPATYLCLSALPSIIGSTAKVFLGAHALLANGSVMSRSGSAMVALLAKSHNVPVLVCCETYKFCERVQTDPFVFNELSGSDRLVGSDPKLKMKIDSFQSSGGKSSKFLTPLSLSFDVTPPSLVDAVVTEIAILPCTSVPVILRVKPSDLPSLTLN